jgi:hypothetical protein
MGALHDIIESKGKQAAIMAEVIDAPLKPPLPIWLTRTAE